MKSRGIFLKNIAAILMLFALLSLLLPFCKVTTPDKSVNVSGFDALTAAARTGLEYHQNGSIEDSYQIKGALTFGDVRNAIQYANEQEGRDSAAKVIAISLLPILLCGLAMILTALATGKVTLFLPTLLIAAAFVENILLIQGFQKVQELIFSDLKTTGVQLGLLIGIYAFTALCGLAAFVLVLGWITLSFDTPEYEDERADRRNGDYDDSGPDHRRRKHNRRDRKRRKTKKKTKTKRKQSSDKKDDNNTKNNQKEPEKADTIVPAQGRISGNSGMFKDVELDLSNQDELFNLGTAKGEMPLSGTQAQEGKYVSIQYDKKQKSYLLTSHSNANIVLQDQQGKQHLLVSGKQMNIGGKTTMYVGSVENSIRFY